MAVASKITINGGTLGNALSYSISSEDSTYKHTLTVATQNGSHSVTILDKSSSKSGTWTPPLAWSSACTTGSTFVVEFTLTTYTSGGTKVGAVYRTKVLTIPDSVVPSVSVSISDAEGHASKYGSYIQNRSKVKATITASGVYGSTIKSVRSTFDDKVYTKTSFTTNTISKSGSLPLSVTVTDSRGRQAKTTVNVSVAEYKIPSFTAFKVARCADAEGNGTSGEFLKVTFSSNVYALNNKNTSSYMLEYKKTTEDDYTSTTLTEYANQYSVSGGVFVFAASSDSSYNIRLTITDSLGSGTKTTIGASSFKLFSVFEKGLGFAFGKFAELAGVLDIGFQTKFSGGVMHPVLEENTDLNDVKIPNTYAGQNATSAGYLNCPVTSGTFTLIVEEAGNAGQLHQIFTLCDKNISRVFERFFYGAEWGEWYCTSGFSGKVLWSGGSEGYYMSSSQTVNLSEPISKQSQGVWLCWGWYNVGDADPVDAEFHYFFVPKQHITLFEGASITMSDYYVGVKKLVYVSDTQIKGSSNNDKEGTDMLTGLAYNNKRLILRAVIGV